MMFRGVRKAPLDKMCARIASETRAIGKTLLLSSVFKRLVDVPARLSVAIAVLII